MEEIIVPPKVIEQLIWNAEDYGLVMMTTAMPEQIENVRRRNELFEKGFGICPNCNRESKFELEFCESCGNSKLPF